MEHWQGNSFWIIWGSSDSHAIPHTGHTTPHWPGPVGSYSATLPVPLGPPNFSFIGRLLPRPYILREVEHTYPHQTLPLPFFLHCFFPSICRHFGWFFLVSKTHQGPPGQGGEGVHSSRWFFIAVFEGHTDTPFFWLYFVSGGGFLERRGARTKLMLFAMPPLHPCCRIWKAIQTNPILGSGHSFDGTLQKAGAF